MNNQKRILDSSKSHVYCDNGGHNPLPHKPHKVEIPLLNAKIGTQ